MELGVFERNKSVHDLLGKFVLTRLYTQGRPGSEEWSAYLEKSFRTSSIPFYAVLSPDDEVLSTHVFRGGILDPFAKEIRDALEAALAEYPPR